MRNRIKQLPSIYFLLLIAILMSQNIGSLKNMGILALFSIPFIIQLIRIRKGLTALLAIFATIYAGWMALAWLSDLLKPAFSSSDSYWLFLLGGLLYVSLNFLMAFIFWYILLNPEEEANPQASA